MALLFSAVTVTANDKKVEFLVGGIPREFSDLEGWTAFERFNTVLLSHKKDNPEMTYEEAKNSITTDKYYSLVLNEVFDTWGHLGWEFEKKHIPFDLIESGYFEDDQEESFGEMTMQ